MINPYALRSPQPDEPSIVLPDGGILHPANLLAVLPRDPKNPLIHLQGKQAAPIHEQDARGKPECRCGADWPCALAGERDVPPSPTVAKLLQDVRKNAAKRQMAHLNKSP